MQDLVDHAWDAEIAAIKDGAPYGTSIAGSFIAQHSVILGTHNRGMPPPVGKI